MSHTSTTVFLQPQFIMDKDDVLLMMMRFSGFFCLLQQKYLNSNE